MLYSGLDSRYMISRLKPPNVKVLSLTTVGSPHRGLSLGTDYSLLCSFFFLQDLRLQTMCLTESDVGGNLVSLVNDVLRLHCHSISTSEYVSSLGDGWSRNRSFQSADTAVHARRL